MSTHNRQLCGINSSLHQTFDLVFYNTSFPVTSMVTAMSDLEGAYFVLYVN